MALAAALAVLTLPGAAMAEDGYKLWLRYAPLQGEAKARLEAFEPTYIQVQSSARGGGPVGTRGAPATTSAPAAEACRISHQQTRGWTSERASARPAA